MKAKIVKGIGGFYYTDTGSEVYECKARGVFRKNGITPLVGDWCEIDIVDAEKKTGNIVKILPRTSALIRPAAANADQAVMIFAVKKPVISTGLLDRFLINMEMQNLDTVIVFSKTDYGEPEELENIYRAAGYRVLGISNKTGEGIDALKEVLRGKTSVLSGPSGVGKSSLINSLLGKTYAETGELSEKIGRGKNTTRHTELFKGDGFYLFDTPGFTSFENYGLDAAELSALFPEFEGFLGKCRFDNCKHISEPDCAVRKAAEEGNISKGRYNSYLEIYKAAEAAKKY